MKSKTNLKYFYHISTLVLFSMAMLISKQSVATHIVGGEMYYDHLGGNDYSLTLIVYRDCGPDNTIGTGFDDQASIGVFNNGNLLDVVEISLSSAEVSFVEVSLVNPCFILPPDLCIEQAVYNATVSLPPISGGYDLVYQRCCRNGSIINLNNPDDTGMTMWSQIPGSDTNANGINNSAQFNNFPPVALCQGAEFFFDHSASDADGDLLSYEFCSPFLGGGSDNGAPQNSPNNPAPVPPSAPNFVPVDWAVGFSEDIQLTASPDFEIDPETGQITGTPTQLGRFAVGICVKEYRNGELISQTMRDFQYQVTVCDPTIIAAIPDQTQFCDGLSFQFENESINTNLYFWDFGDPNSTQDTSSLNSPFYVYSEPGEYEVTLIANPEWSCADTATVIYQAFPSLTVAIDGFDYQCVNGISEFELNASGSYDINDVELTWDFPAALNVSGTDSPSEMIIDPPPGNYGVTFTALENGCEAQQSYELIVPPDPVASISPQSLFCEGFTFDFINSSENATEYVWDFGVIGSSNDGSNLFEPSFTYPDSGSYTVHLDVSAPFTCPDQTSATFDIQGLLNPYYTFPEPQCFDNHSFNFEAEGFDSQDPLVEWEFGELANPVFGEGIVINGVSWSEPGIFPVTLTISENDCLKSVTQDVEIITNPIPDFHVFLTEGCPPIDVGFYNDSEGETNLSYLWDFGDGQTSTEENPNHTYVAPGFYDVTLNVTSSSGCVDDVNITFENIVEVFPSPTAGFEADFYTVSYLEPTVTITDLSEGGTTCYYDFGDGTFTQECDPIHDFVDAGFFDVTQTVYNNFGCFDQITIPFTVEGHFLYAPNSFTPNNDNINEVFKPIIIGVSRYDLKIYNRWGEVVFHTTDPDQGWNGAVNFGQHYAPNGVYNYQILAYDLFGFGHEYSGHLSLIR